jgi:photosystem II stability/assembly factor-like uncharacterized protein
MKVRVLGALLLGALAVPIGAQETQKADDSYVPTYRQLKDTALDEPNGEDPEARREWMRERFAGDLTPEFTQLVVNELAKAQARNPEAYKWNGAVQAAAPGNWFSIGPVRSDWIRNGVRVTASDTGRIRTVLPHPSNPDILYLLTSSGGLWKTTDFTQPRPKWRPLTDAIYGANGGSVAFGRSAETLYYGTGDPFDIGVGGLLYKSTDGGSTWASPVALGSSTYVTDVNVDTSEAQDIVLVGTNTGLFRSVDNGASFTQIAAGAGQAFAGKRVWSLVRTSEGWLAAAEASSRVGSIYRSTDKGATWNLVFSPAAPGEISRTTLGVGAPGDSVVYAFANGFTYNQAGQRVAFRQRDLFRSEDGGQTWTPLGLPNKKPLNPTAYQPDLNVMAGQPTYNQMLLVDRTDASRNTVYLGGQFASVKSVDGGNTWRVIADWLALDKMPYVHADYHAAALSTTGGQKTILFGTDGGLFITTDDGVSFSDLKNDGISSYMIYAMTSNAKNTDDVLIGLQDNGTRLRFGSGMTYNQVYGGDGFGVGWGQAGDTVAIGSLYYSRMFRSENNPPATQEKWRFGSTGIAETNNPSTSYFVTSITTPNASADPTGLVFYTRTRNKVYKTANGAALWTKFWESPQVQTGVDANGNPVYAYTRVVRAGSHPVGVSPTSVDRVTILLNGGFAVFTTDGGQTWTEKNLTTAVAGWPGFNSTVAYASNDVLYVGNESAAAVPMRVIKSTDGGNTWAPATAGLPNVPVTELLVSPKDPDTVYAATWIGVYRSTDGGASWSIYGNGLPVAVISDLYMPPDGAFLRASSYGRGVWEIR